VAAFSSVSTDSRAVSAGGLFVALRGDRFDGHDYVRQAHAQGAVAALVSRPVGGCEDVPQIVVDDTRAGLGRLAAAWRSRFRVPVAAITGSNGKTTVKEMTAAILAAHAGDAGAVLATEGNLNNDIGLPVMLLRLRASHRYAVLEMGMNHEGEIAYLSRLAAPGVALVNNAQRAHIGLLGSLEAIARAKGEIYGGLAADGVALVNADDAHADYWRRLAKGCRLVTFGLSPSADVRGEMAAGELRLVTPADAFAVRLRVPGVHNARNAIAACAVAYALGVPWQAMQAGLAGFTGAKGRLERKAGRAGSAVIDDTYNANPDSTRAAIAVLAAMPGRRVLVLGDMGELGEGALALHAEIGAVARAAGIERLVALGELSAQAAQAFGDGAACVTSAEAAAQAAGEGADAATVILVKGSRFMRMERVVSMLVETDKEKPRAA
jgi:UDP-N-acetylmuramoyl-tripeptide--D-alanyl-D-alanine ligase